LCAAGAAKKKDKLLTMDSSEITYEMVAKKLREIVTSRGRKGTDKQEQVRNKTLAAAAAQQQCVCVCVVHLVCYMVRMAAASAAAAAVFVLLSWL
jgi:translation initiation factor 3 subunit C